MDFALGMLDNETVGCASGALLGVGGWTDDTTAVMNW